ncbi:MAG: 3-oxoacyl-[acyl-carrier-protein] reductase [Bryobacterales bacterium]|nr:3-oxoacyl-[acyl-carrier-protein] reductase [Bryobacterales bacterium]
MTQRNALVTGASRGIGKACALALAAAGHRVVLAARDLTKLEEVAAQIREAGGTAFVVKLDLADLDSIPASFKNATDQLGGPIQILVNNAGITKDGLSMRMKRADFETVLDTNLTAAFVAIQQVTPAMLRERWGRIINLSSVVAQAGNAGQSNYVASKAGLIGLTKALAQEIASRNVTVNAVAPGFIETDMTAVLSAEVKERILQGIPMKRMGSAEDVAAAVRFLASEEAGYITGHVLNVNGGMYMS